MTVLCAWCLREGKQVLLEEVEPYEDPSESHGICPDHLAQAKLELARTAEAQSCRVRPDERLSHGPEGEKDSPPLSSQEARKERPQRSR